MYTTFRHFSTNSTATEMNLVQRFCKAWMLLLKNCWQLLQPAIFRADDFFPVRIVPLHVVIWPSSNMWFLGLTWVHSPNGILIGSAVLAGLTIVTGQPTDRQTHHATQSATVGRTYIVVRYRLIISCEILYWKMVLTSRTISVKFIMSVYIRLRTCWMPLVCL